MSDNVQPTNVTSPASFAFRTEDRGTTSGVTVQTPVTLIDIGGTNSESILSPTNPLPVTDISTDDGLRVVELLSQILVEQRITNLYLYNLANNINLGLPETDDPFRLRSELNDFQL